MTFLGSWGLMGDAYLLALSQAALLSLVGILVVARNQIFIGAALAQASTLGIAVALWLATTATFSGLAGWLSGGGQAVLAVAAAVAGALVITRQTDQGSRVGGDEMTGWMFVGCAALTSVVLSQNPAAMDQVRAVQGASFIGASALDVGVIAAVLLVVVAGLWSTRRQLVLLIADPVMAAAIGMNVGIWSRVIAVTIGLTIGLAIQTSGLVYTFGCLILPALTAKAVCRRIGGIFLVAPLVSVGCAMLGLVLSFRWNVPMGQLIVAIQALALLAAWGLSSLLRRPPKAVIDTPT